MAEKILLDTDIGNDIDDAVCLAYLLAQRECELLGITTVTGQPEVRAQIASALCRAAHVDVPIYPGAEYPLLSRLRQRDPHQASMLPRWPHAERFPRGEAVEFMRRTIRAHPGEVTLLTIGPLTNIALLFAVDPEIPGMLKALVSMAGLYTERPAQHHGEWNAINDGHATSIVYRAPVPVHRCVGLDVTLAVRLEAPDVRERFGAIQQLAPVLDMAETRFRTRPDLQRIIFHDPLAAAVVFDPTICEWRSGAVAVDLVGEPGWTTFTETPEGAAPGRHQVAVEVSPERFFAHYFGAFS